MAARMKNFRETELGVREMHAEFLRRSGVQSGDFTSRISSIRRPRHLLTSPLRRDDDGIGFIIFYGTTLIISTSSSSVPSSASV